MKKILYTLMAVILIATAAQNALADKIVLLDNNQESLQARTDYIQGAKESIKAQYFTIENDSLTRTALALLRDAADRGVNVKILVDSMHNLMLRETMSAVLLNLHPEKKKNIEIREYNTFNLFRLFRYTKRMHDKGMIIDDKYMISGGRNIANGYYGVPDLVNGKALPIYEDSDALVLESQAIRTASKYFDDLWNSKFVTDVELYEYSADRLDKNNCRYEENSFSCESEVEYKIKNVLKEEKKLAQYLSDYKNNRLKAVRYEMTDWISKAIEVQTIDFLFDDVTQQNSSLKKPANSIGVQLYNAIKRAEDSVIIITPYLVVTPEQEQLFKALREKNVEVTVITNSKGSNDVPAAHVGYDKTKNLALEAGVTLLEYQGPDTLHAKMVLIDRSIVFIGSFNWDFRSQNLNREVGIIAELPADKKNDLTNDLIRKFATIMKKTCRIGAKICSVSRGETLDKLEPEEYNALVKAFKIREQESGSLYRILFPVIKGQL